MQPRELLSRMDAFSPIEKPQICFAVAMQSRTLLGCFTRSILCMKALHEALFTANNRPCFHNNRPLMSAYLLLWFIWSYLMKIILVPILNNLYCCFCAFLITPKPRQLLFLNRETALWVPWGCALSFHLKWVVTVIFTYFSTSPRAFSCSAVS